MEQHTTLKVQKKYLGCKKKPLLKNLSLSSSFFKMGKGFEAQHCVVFSTIIW